MSTQWFVKSSSKTYGPFSPADLKRLADSGKLKPETQVATSQNGPWHPAVKVRGLFTASQQPTAASTGGQQPQTLPPDAASLRRLCFDIDAPDFFIASDLTEKQLARICKAYNIPSPELLIAILDGSIFKTGTLGLAICTDGLRWKNDAVDTTKNYLTWQELRASEPQLTSQKHIDLGNAMVIDLSSTKFPLLEVVPLLKSSRAPNRSPQSGSADLPRVTRRPRSLRFAYKEAVGATFISVMLCIIAVGFIGGFFLALFKKMDQSRFGSAEKSFVAAAESPRGGQPASASRQSSTTTRLLTAEQAELAIKQKGASLDLRTFTHMTDEAAEILSRYQGHLELDGVVELSAQQARALSRHGKLLTLRSLATISDDTAEALGKGGNVLTLGVTVLSERQCEMLAASDSGLYLDRLEIISDGMAEALAKHSGILGLWSLTTLSNNQAAALGSHAGGMLQLNGLTILSDEQASSLSQHRGQLELTGLRALSGDAEALLRARANVALPERPLAVAAARRNETHPSPRQAERRIPKSDPETPPVEPKRHRLIRTLIGRWSGLWTDGNGKTGPFRMTVVADDAYNAQHAKDIRSNREDPHVFFRMHVSGMPEMISDSPFSTEFSNPFDWNSDQQISFGLTHPDGGGIYFQLQADVTGEQLYGQIFGCPGGVGRYVLERQH
jgi:hypothetical protein